MRFLHISDLHIQPSPDDRLAGLDTYFTFTQVLADAFQRNPGLELIVITGDLAQSPCRESYRRIRQALAVWQTPVLCLPGNHDDVELMGEILHQGLISCDKQTVLQGWQFVCLNSQKPGFAQGWLAKSELDFLGRCLQQPLPTVIALHHHCLPSGSPWMDSMMIENGRELVELISAYPQAKLLIHGHVHQPLEWHFDQFSVYATPATCVQFQPLATEFKITDQPPGYRIVDLKTDGRFETECVFLPRSTQHPDLNSHAY